MLNTILKSIISGSPRVLVNWDKAVVTIKLRTEIIKTRYLGTGFIFNPGTNMLINILQNIIYNNPGLRSCKSDYKRYVEVIDPQIAIYRNYFDPVYLAQQTKGIFCWDKNIPEYILNVSMDKPLSTLPMDKPWEYWKDLVPIHVIYHDSRELCTNLLKLQLKFEKDPPHAIFYSIDLTMLIFMYLKYMEYMESFSKEPSVHDFLQQYVLVNWFDDLRRIWLFNILKDAAHNDFKYEKFKADELVAPNTMLKTLKADLSRLFDDARKKAVSLGDICATRWFGDTSLTWWLNELNTNLQVPPLRQYKWLSFASTLPYAEFMLDILLLIKRNDINPVVRNLLFDLHQYHNQNICSNIQNPEYRAEVSKQLKRMITRIEDIRYL